MQSILKPEKHFWRLFNDLFSTRDDILSLESFPTTFTSFIWRLMIRLILICGSESVQTLYCLCQIYRVTFFRGFELNFGAHLNTIHGSTSDFPGAPWLIVCRRTLFLLPPIRTSVSKCKSIHEDRKLLGELAQWFQPTFCQSVMPKSTSKPSGGDFHYAGQWSNR